MEIIGYLAFAYAGILIFMMIFRTGDFVKLMEEDRKRKAQMFGTIGKVGGWIFRRF